VTQIVSNEYGCVSQPSVADVHVYPVPTASFTNSPDSSWIFESLIQFQNSSIGAAQYQWDFGDGTSANFFHGEHAYSDTGTFEIRLIVTSTHGCIDTVYGRVRIFEGFSFYVPNAFTPNEDGINDYFQGYGTFINKYEMWIYDRWGLMIYHTNDYYKPWDGRMNTMCQNDTYVYRIKVTDYGDKDHIFIGSVTLVK
jgi:gliding motility-associated-like protein